MKKKKTYEVPVLTVTELETKDVMMVSGLIGQGLITAGEHLGYEMIEIDLQ